VEASKEYSGWVAELREKQAEAISLHEKIEDGKSSADEQKKFRALVADVKSLSGKVEKYRTAQSVGEFQAMMAAEQKSKGSSPTNGNSSRLVNLGAVKTETEVINEETLRRYSSFQREFGSEKFDAISHPEYKAATEAMLRYGYSGMDRGYRKAIDSGADERGAITAPVEVLNFILTRLNAPTRVAGLVREINTSRDSVQFYRNAYDSDDEYTNVFRRVKTGSRPASDSEALVTGSGASQSSYIVPTKIQVHTMMMVGQIENDLLEDSTFDLLNWFQTEITRSAAQDRDNDIINGIGVGEPMGLMNYVGTGETFSIGTVNSGSASALTVDGLSNLLWDLPEQYIENAILLMKRTGAGKAIGALRSSDGKRIYGDPDAANGASMVGPSGQRLEGYPVIYSSKMPSVAANAFPILFFDPSAYISLTRSNISIKILDQTRAKQNMTEVVAKIRYGGDLGEPYKCRAQKISA